MVTFSLIIPIFNTPDADRRLMLDKLARSIPDRGDLEVLWVDDHSSLPWCPPCFRHTKSQLIENDPGDRFAGTARNAGMKAASGKFILFADSDDCFEPGAMGIILDDAVADSDWDMILFSCDSFLEDGSQGDRHLHINRSVRLFAETGDHDALVRYHPPYGRIISTDFIARNELFFGDTRAANDVLMAVEIALSKPRTRIIQKTGYWIRQGNPSLTTISSPENVDARLSVARDIQALMKEYGRSDLIIPLHRNFRQYAKHAPSVVLRHLISAIKCGDRVVPPPGKAAHTIMRRLRGRSRVIDRT